MYTARNLATPGRATGIAIPVASFGPPNAATGTIVRSCPTPVFCTPAVVVAPGVIEWIADGLGWLRRRTSAVGEIAEPRGANEFSPMMKPAVAGAMSWAITSPNVSPADSSIAPGYPGDEVQGVLGDGVLELVTHDREIRGHRVCCEQGWSYMDRARAVPERVVDGVG